MTSYWGAVQPNEAILEVQSLLAGLAPGVTTPAIEELMARATAAGAKAAKVCGAGGGGCLFCIADPSDVPAVREALANGGARLLDFRIEPTGLEVAQE